MRFELKRGCMRNPERSLRATGVPDEIADASTRNGFRWTKTRAQLATMNKEARSRRASSGFDGGIFEAYNQKLLFLLHRKKDIVNFKLGSASSFISRAGLLFRD
jgi:hypothetical protein